MLLVTKVHILFKFPNFLSNVIFLLKHPIQDTTLRSVIMFPWALPSCGRFLDFPCLG